MILLDTVRWLIDIPSETGKEGRLCTAIAQRLLPSFGEDAVRRVGNSLVVGRRTGRPLLLLVGHIDTVPAQGEWQSRVEGDRIVGLGAADMKAGVAVIIHLLEEVVSPTYDVVGVFYEGEEGPSSGNGLEPVLRRLDWIQDAEFAIVMEPSDDEIQLGCNGAMNAEVTFTGKSAHSARPWWGENAISKAGEWLAAMHRREPRPVTIDGLEFKEVMSVTMASGGVARNIIPPSATFNVNYRFTPDLTMEEAEERLLAELGADAAVEIIDVAPAGPVRADHPVARALAEVSGKPFAAKQGWTDVARLGTFGIPAVNYGPGSTEQAHVPGEWVARQSVEEAYRVLSELVGRSA